MADPPWDIHMSVRTVFPSMGVFNYDDSYLMER
jgi:hypothetical protein